LTVFAKIRLWDLSVVTMAIRAAPERDDLRAAGRLVSARS
jgi:hypothetical protein